MIPNITKGERMVGLLAYLQGPGKANEHTYPHVVGGHDFVRMLAPAGELSHDDAIALGRSIDEPRRTFGTQVSSVKVAKAAAGVAAGAPAGVAVADATTAINVWHCSLALNPEEGRLPEHTWEAIARDFMKEMGFDDPDDPRPPARWIAIHHGATKRGGDHIHIAASPVREDGTKVSLTNDYRRAQTAAGVLEQRYGLRITEGRAQKLTTRGTNPAQEAIRTRDGVAETSRQQLERRVRACAVASKTEAEFVSRVRRDGLLIRPRYAKGSHTDVVGYSVAKRPQRRTDRSGTLVLVWHGGGKLARDLTLPRLREAWSDSPTERRNAHSEWNRATDRRAPGRVPTARGNRDQLLAAARENLAEWDQWMRSIPIDDRAAWAHAAGETAGMYAMWSARVEQHPGQLAQTAAALSNATGIHANARPARTVKMPSLYRAAATTAMLLSNDPDLAWLALAHQLTAFVKAIADANRAAGDAGRAGRLTDTYRDLLAAQKDAQRGGPTVMPQAPRNATRAATQSQVRQSIRDAEHGR